MQSTALQTCVGEVGVLVFLGRMEKDGDETEVKT